MGCRLTYSDREFLLQTFETLKSEWNGKDEQLLEDACHWAKQLEPSCGFEHALVRDITILSRYLTSHQEDKELSDIARGGLLYVLHAGQCNSSRLGKFGLLDDAFISSFATHEIRVRLGEQAIYNPPQLTRDEQRHAENLFRELAAEPISSDQYLITKSRSVCDGLSNLAACGLFQRLKRNVDFLISVISRPGSSQEQRRYARAALGYLICEDDVIDDRLGIVGYLDDNFIAQVAVDLIEPNREPWVEILDATIGEWPFLNFMVIDAGSGGHPISEYMILNSALSCESVRGDHDDFTVLVVSSVGPTPVLLGFVASLGLVQNSERSKNYEKEFIEGQKVLVDNNAVRLFSGVKEIQGRKMFGLTKELVRKGHKQPCTSWWPISEMSRIIPVDSSRATRGTIVYDLGKSDAIFPALQYLFKSNRFENFSSIQKKVIVVTPVAFARDLAKHLRFCDFPLKEVIPMGNIVDNKIKPWSTSFGQQEPLLLFVPDLDVACDYAEKHQESINTVIVGATGRNSRKFGSLKELQRMEFQTLVITPERSAAELPAEDDDSTFLWEWNPRDLSSLLWPQYQATDTDDAIFQHEHRIKTQSSVKPKVICIDSELTDEVFESVRRLKSVAHQRGEDSLVELDELLDLVFGATTRMFRLATPLTEDVPSCIAIENDIKKIFKISRESRYLSEVERAEADNTKKLLQNLFERLKKHNPKATAIQELLETNPGQAIICPDARLFSDLNKVYGNKGLRILSSYTNDYETYIGSAIIPGWFRKDRMARLLVPPVTQKLTLLLYNLESRWYAGFCHQRQKFRIKRSKHGRRSKVFPVVKGWAEHENIAISPAKNENDTNVLHELESVQERIQATRRKRAYQNAKSDGSETVVPARLVLFEGGAHAFLRDSHKTIVVTHLLDDAIEESEDERVDVSHKTVEELKTNDAILFHLRSDRNVIRMVADEDMPDGLRETAIFWKKALLNYVNKENLNPHVLRERLRKAGCSRHIQTIKDWLYDNDRIAPRDYEKDVAIIAKVTGDPYLNSQLGTVLKSISAVFGAHQRASSKLAQQIVHRVIEILQKERDQSKTIKLESDIVVARVVEIDKNDTQVRLSIVNRLQESGQWHE